MSSTHDVRRTFLDHFVARGHRQVPGSSLVPSAGSGVLFTVAGMQQMIPYFIGREAAPHERMTTVQKCFRTVDIDDVGRVLRTLTFFEMLGNFSVGDYFKREATAFAYELLRDGFHLNPHDLWYTVHPTDDEAVQAWQRLGVPRARILQLDDNWWPSESASVGPCGPDSEIFVDRGAAFGCGKPTCGPGCGCSRFLEIWNLVFMQYARDEAGALHDLPRRNIDTGMGLERMAMVLQGAESPYELDLFRPILDQAGAIARVSYGEQEAADRSLRIMVDHARSATFLVADGVIPANTGRGYVLRRIIRRAVRNGKLLRVDGPFLVSLADIVVGQLQVVYPELAERRDRIFQVLGDEERRFGQTLASGLRELERIVAETRERGEQALRGSDVFRLYDSHGLPLEVVKEVAHDEQFSVDEDSFERLLLAQRQRGQRIAREGRGTIAGDRRTLAFDGLDPTVFLGYEGEQAPGAILRLLVGDEVQSEATDGQTVSLALDQTPFYALGGGQVPDTGVIAGPEGTLRVDDVQRTESGVLVHIGTVRGKLAIGETVDSRVDAQRRSDIARNHTATHLVHRALRGLFGEQVTQAGSVVAPDRLRFDFTYGASPTDEQLRAVEQEVNAAILANRPVTTTYRQRDEAIAEGAMALFGEKYGEVVRTVAIDDYSRELCGGTHVSATGSIGSFFVVAEDGVGAGHRRIEAVTGPGAIAYAGRHRGVVAQLAQLLQAPSDGVVKKVTMLVDEQQELRRQLETAQRTLAKSTVDALAAKAERIGPVTYVGAYVEVPRVELLREMSDWLRDRLGSAVTVLGASAGDRGTIVVSVTPDLVRAGWDAGVLAKEIGRAAGGSGGGRATLAQAGVSEPARIGDGLRRGRELLAVAQQG